MFTLNCNGRLVLIDKPIVMGIVNATPDSFYEGSRMSDPAAAVKKAGIMIHEGATIIDIGGQSSRPGSELIPAHEELYRVLPVIEAIHSAFPELVISIDTFYASVAAAAIKAGASIINDISAGNMDAGMIETVSGLGVPYVLMHLPGTPQTMQYHKPYKNVALEVFDFMREKLLILENAGVKDVIIDPGFGFGKTARDNFDLMNDLGIFRILGRPLLIGISRKSFIHKTLGISPDDSLNGTSVMNTIGLMKGADILRVHDVKEAWEAAKLAGETRPEQKRNNTEIIP